MRRVGRRAPPNLLAVELEPGPLRDALIAVVEVRALLPLVRVRSRARTLSVLDDERKTVVRHDARGAALVAAGRRAAACARASARSRCAAMTPSCIHAQVVLSEESSGSIRADGHWSTRPCGPAGGRPRGSSKIGCSCVRGSAPTGRGPRAARACSR